MSRGKTLRLSRMWTQPNKELITEEERSWRERLRVSERNSFIVELISNKKGRDVIILLRSSFEAIMSVPYRHW